MDFIKLFKLPINASSHGHEVDTLIFLVHIVMLVLFTGWGVYFLFTLFRFHQKNNPKASYTGVTSHFTSWIEMAIIVVEIILLAGFSIPFWAKQVNAFPKRTDVVNVRVIAEQFAWNVHYPGADGVFGKTHVEFFDKQSNPIGLDPNDPHGKDDFTTINQLHLPIGKPAIIQLSSKDVIHSFALPVMRVKQDVIPGMSIPTWFTPTKTGNFEIACAQLCGLGHYRMKGFLTIHSQEDYAAWLEEQSTAVSDAGEYDDFWN